MPPRIAKLLSRMRATAPPRGAPRRSSQSTSGSSSAASIGDSTDAVPNPTTNNYVNITGGTTTISPGTVIVVDGTNATIGVGSYSFRIAGGAGAQNFTISNSSQFSFINVPADPSSVSLTGDASGTLYLNFTTVVPEPAGPSRPTSKKK